MTRVLLILRAPTNRSSGSLRGSVHIWSRGWRASRCASGGCERGLLLLIPLGCAEWATHHHGGRRRAHHSGGHRRLGRGAGGAHDVGPWLALGQRSAVQAGSHRVSRYRGLTNQIFPPTRCRWAPPRSAAVPSAPRPCQRGPSRPLRASPNPNTWVAPVCCDALSPMQRLTRAFAPPPATAETRCC